MTQQGTDVSWALRDLVESIPEIRFALVASSDGKAITAFGAEDPDDVDRFAAVVAGLQALAQPVAEQFPKYAGQLRLAMIEVDGGHLFVVRAGVEQAPGDLNQELVSRRVTPAVVDVLEMVQVDEEDRVSPLIRRPTRQRLDQLVGEECAVGKARERIVIRRMAELLLQLIDLRKRLLESTVLQ